MIRTLKPLFRPEVLRHRLRSFAPRESLEDARRRIAVFAGLLGEGRARGLTEENLKPAFLANA